jgi:beta-lactam-binding protein with PASTA domain
MIRLVVLVLAAAGLVAAAAITTADYLSVDDVRLPDVRGVPYTEATERLRAVGLRVLTYPDLDASAAPGTVMSQTPPSGSVVRSGRTVSLGVNAGADARQVPTLVGLGERDALARAADLGIGVERVVYVSVARPVGMVVGQRPEAGTPLGPEEALTIEVSRGEDGSPIELPDVRGLTLDAARAALTQAGVRRVDAVAADVSFDQPNTVTDQRPVAGAEVMPSTPVTLVYALEGMRVVRVPDVEGQPLWQAQLAIRAAQLALGPVQLVDDPTRPAGVLEARPAGYTVAGSPVALVVNGPVREGFEPDVELEFGLPGRDALREDDDAATAIEPDVPAPGTTMVQADGSRLIPFRFDPGQVGVAALTREPYRLTLVVSDAQGERTVLDRELAAGEGVVTSIRIEGDEPLLQTFINGSFFQAWRP